MRSRNKVTLIADDSDPENAWIAGDSNPNECTNCVFEEHDICGDGVFECRAAYRSDSRHIIWKLIEEPEQVLHVPV